MSKHRSSVLCVAGAALVNGGAAPPAAAQWTVVNLHPAGALYSRALDVHGGQQVGIVGAPDGFEHASLWNGSAPSWVDLHPSGATSSQARGVCGGQQIGFAIFGGQPRASLWCGTAASRVDLTPPGAVNSIAAGMDSNQQVGMVSLRASVWSGTAQSWVDLHVAGAGFNASNAFGADAGQQAGHVFNAPAGGVGHASLWTGTAASWADLHPSGASESIVWDMHGGQQVGYAVISGAKHASMWTGTAASWVNLHPLPTGVVASEASGVFAGTQVGFVTLLKSGLTRACLWTGSAGSFIDLHAYLPPHFSQSRAVGVWQDDHNRYIAGSGFNTSTNRDEALMWVGSLPCTGNIVNSGTSANRVDVDDLLAVLMSWGPCPAPPASCSANIVNTGSSLNRVDIDDLLAVMTSWGACP